MPRYTEFADKINMDDFYAEIGFEVLHVKGSEDVGHCLDPWGMHKNGDSTGKLAFNREKRVYNCWVCGGGSLLSFVMEVRNCDPEEATNWLLQFATDRDRTDDEFVDDIRAILSQLDVKREKVTMPYFNEKVLLKWSGEQLGSPWDERPYEWLEERHIDLGVAMGQMVGFDPEAKKWAPRNKATGEPLDDPYVGPAMVLPLFWQTRLVGWQHRWLEDDRPKWCAKYTNTPDFPKRHTLWNFARPMTSHALPPVVVESVPTALMVESLGWPALCTFGASVTPEQMKLLRRFQQGLIFSPDNDKPGLEALVKEAEYLEDFIPVSYIDPTEWGEGHDLGDFCQIAGESTVRNLIENPIRIA